MGSIVTSVDKPPAASLARPQIPASNITIHQQQSSSVPLHSQHVQAAIPPFSLPHKSIVAPEKHQTPIVHSLHRSLHANSPASPIMSTQSADVALATKTNLLSVAGRPSLRMETITNNAKPSTLLMTQERQPVSLQFPTSTWRQAPLQPDSPVHAPSYSSRQPMGNAGAVPDSWRGRLGLGSNPYSPSNQNGYNASSHGQPLSAPQWEGTEQAGSDGFESWSPENSPRSKSPKYMRGRNLGESRMNSGWDRLDRSRQQNSPRNWDRRWRDRSR